jgi:hypothetical protein
MLNNLSRIKFKEFLQKNTWLKRVDSRNVCADPFGNIYAFCIVQTDKIECRQFYADCTDLICLNVTSNKLLQIPREHLHIDVRPNRVTIGGCKAFTARAESKNAFAPALVI